MEEHETQLQADTTEWLESLREAALPAQVSARSAEKPVAVPPLDRERPERRPLVPRGVILSVVGVLAALLLVIVFFAWTSSRSQVAVPAITGLDVGVARTNLTREGLELAIAEKRFSASPEGTILSQSPSAGSKVDEGSSVRVVVSAGTEEISMPDVVGDGIVLATGVLEDLGLRVEVERVLSDTASDTVLSSVPAAGATVRSGDTVRLEVATPRGTAIDVKPYKLDGMTVVIDAAPLPEGLTGDPVLEVARRLEAMLSASGARGVVLRSAFDTSSTDATRAKRAREASPTVSIGLTIATGSSPGRTVSVPPSQTAGASDQGARLADGIVSELGTAAPPVVRSISTHDPVLAGAGAPWIRVILGSAEARDDATMYADPNWADRVARALYAAIGGVFGEPVLP